MEIFDCFRRVPDRHWLLLLNSLVFLLSGGQSTLGMNFIVRIFSPSSLINEEDQEDEMLTAWIVLTSLSLLCAAASIFGLVAAKRVSMDQLIAYFAFVVVLIAPILLFTLMTFEYQTIFRAWLRHRWYTPNLDEVRRYFCVPKHTWNTLCRAGPLEMPLGWTNASAVLTSPTGVEFAPSQRGDSFGVNEWCQWNYDSLECKDIFHKALKSTTIWARFWLRASGLVSLLNVLLLSVCLSIVTRIVTPPIIMKYMLTKVNAMLVLPGTGVLLLGLDLTGRLSTTDADAGTDFRVVDKNIVVIGYLNCVTAVFILTTFLLGVDRERLKGRRSLQTYTVLLSAALALLLIAGIWCLLISYTIADTLEKGEWQGGSFACKAHLYGCSNCDSDDVSGSVDQCPEWSRRDIVDYVQVYLRMGGLFSLTSVVYVGAALVAALRLAKNLREYRCEYI